MTKEQTNKDLSEVEILFREHYPSLVNYVCTYVYNKSVADDIIQDVFLSIWINRDKIDTQSKYIKSYLYKAVRNRSLNYIQSVKDSLPFRIDDIDFLIQKQIFADKPYDNLLVDDLQQEIKKCINNLPPQCKKVFLYSRVNNIKNKEIATQLNISEKTVEKHITKALSEIRLHLSKANLLSTLVFLFHQI